jgi:hypothetical protein
MSILTFDKPKKILSPSDPRAGQPYALNMSTKDMNKWKAKKIGGDDPRIEIRKSIHGHDPAIEKIRKTRGYSDGKSKEPNASAQILLIVRSDGSTVMSANGRMTFDGKTWHELEVARKEAFMELMQDEYLATHPRAKWNPYCANM